MHAIAGVRLTCVSDFPIATYSGMLAGTLAGQYEPDEMQIDLVRLCASCGVRLVIGKVVGLDRDNRQLLLADRPPVRFDSLSIGIGSRPTLPPGENTGLSIKPMQTFLPRLRAEIERQLAERSGAALEFAVVGGGAAGVEIACCLQEFLKQHYADLQTSKITLIEAADEILSTMPRRTRQLAAIELERRGIRCLTGRRIAKTNEDGKLTFEGSSSTRADIVLWATSARPPELLGELGLPTDERGFLLTRSTLQSTEDENVFAVGDSGTVAGEDYAKAGVYAVRQGPVLWENLRRRHAGEQLQTWRPQSQFLSLIGSGDDRAILTYRGISLHAGAWWRLKDWIDRRFMAKYQSYEPPAMMTSSPTDSVRVDQQPPCGGCGSKASSRVLQRALSQLEQPPHERVLIGLDAPDDIALVSNQPNQATASSTDFFTAFVDDPYLLGRIAALNALSDLYVKSARPHSALSIAVVPEGTEEQQARLLSELLAGAAREFSEANVAIVGGHSIVGPKLTIGFTVLGDADPSQVVRKTSLAAGDCFVLTKSLGTGVLLAGHMQAKCRAAWWTALVESMLASNRQAATIAQQREVSAATDVTGFGLAGHLQEMLAGTQLSAELSLSALPLLPGAGELLDEGIESTLAPANRAGCPSVSIPAAAKARHANILFDPQTSGGLLLAVAESQLQQLLATCEPPATKIGRIIAGGDKATQTDAEQIRVLP